MGDFNINLLRIDTQKETNKFFTNLTSYFFAPYVLQPTRPVSKTLIDNIFINTIEFPSYSGNISINLSDHFFQFAILEGFFKDIIPSKTNLFERNYKHFNEREFLEDILNINWDDVLQIQLNDPNTSIDHLFNKFTFLLDEFAPLKKLSKNEIKLKSKPWITKEIQFLMWERDKMFKQYCKESNPNKKTDLFNRYKIMRNNLTDLKRTNKIDYYKNYFSNNSKKVSAIWKGIRTLVNIKQTSKKDVNLLDDNGSMLTDPIKIANYFNQNFINMGPGINNKIPIGKYHYTKYLSNVNINNSMFLNPTTPSEISDIILSLDINKSMGPNSLPIYIIKLCNELFSNCLAKIINLSFSTGIFPDHCKMAKVIPIYKKDNPLLWINYRPISLLPIFSKIFEKVIYTRMYKFLEDNKLIYTKQFGFRANHSTNHALISMTESIKSFLDCGNYVAGIFIDLEKAFDTVNHQILCRKLEYYGFRGKSNELIKSFLSNRKQLVSINGFESTPLEIKCGVPQGSTLGPLLFLLYINDLHYCLKYATASHFADDTAIVYANKNIKTLESNLNYDLKAVSEWLRSNRLSLNVNKTKLLYFRSSRSKFNSDNISIKLQGTKLINTDNVKYLGLFIDDHLSWTTHTKYLSLKLSRSNGILSKLRHFVPKDILCSVYYSIFYSHLNYGCPVWTLTSTENFNLINVLQKKCLRIINFAPFNSHSSPLFASNNLLKFEHIILSNQLSLIFNFNNNNLPADLSGLFKATTNVHSYNTRNASTDSLYIPSVHSTNFGLKSLKYSAPFQWNKFISTNPSLLNANSSNSFMTSLKKHFISTYNPNPND